MTGWLEQEETFIFPGLAVRRSKTKVLADLVLGEGGLSGFREPPFAVYSHDLFFMC